MGWDGVGWDGVDKVGWCGGGGCEVHRFFGLGASSELFDAFVCSFVYSIFPMVGLFWYIDR